MRKIWILKKFKQLCMLMKDATDMFFDYNI